MVDERDGLTHRFEDNRTHLRTVAYRMLGSVSEADDAVQETWLRLNNSDAGELENLRGWLTTVVGRICLDMLRSRASRREELVGARLPEPIPAGEHRGSPENEAVVNDAVGQAMLVVCDTLNPPERLAFVLHDMFGIPFDEIALIVDRTPAAARQLASRARRRIRGTVAIPDADFGRQREVVNAFLAAARGGDFQALVAVLDPDVILRVERGVGAVDRPRLVRGATAVAHEARSSTRRAKVARPAIVDGGYALVVASRGRLRVVLTFAVADERIVEVNVLSDPATLGELEVEYFDVSHDGSEPCTRSSLVPDSGSSVVGHQA